MINNKDCDVDKCCILGQNACRIYIFCAFYRQRMCGVYIPTLIRVCFLSKWGKVYNHSPQTPPPPPRNKRMKSSFRIVNSKRNSLKTSPPDPPPPPLEMERLVNLSFSRLSRRNQAKMIPRTPPPVRNLTGTGKKTSS
jgi:hypothetical protein